MVRLPASVIKSIINQVVSIAMWMSFLGFKYINPIQGNLDPGQEDLEVATGLSPPTPVQIVSVVKATPELARW